MNLLPPLHRGSPVLLGRSAPSSRCFSRFLRHPPLLPSTTSNSRRPPSTCAAAAAPTHGSAADACADVSSTPQFRCMRVSSRSSTLLCCCCYLGSAVPVLAAAVAAASLCAYPPTAGAFHSFLPHPTATARRLTSVAATAAAAVLGPTARPAAAHVSLHPLFYYAPVPPLCVGSSRSSSRCSWSGAAASQPPARADSAAAAAAPSFLRPTAAARSVREEEAAAAALPLIPSAGVLPPTAASTSSRCFCGLLLQQTKAAGRPGAHCVLIGSSCCSGRRDSLSSSSSVGWTTASRITTHSSHRRRCSVAPALRSACTRSHSSSTSASVAAATAAGTCSNDSSESTASSLSCSPWQCSRHISSGCLRSSSSTGTASAQSSANNSLHPRRSSSQAGGCKELLFSDCLKQNRRRSSSKSSAAAVVAFTLRGGLACRLTHTDCGVRTVERCSSTTQQWRQLPSPSCTSSSRGRAGSPPASYLPPFSFSRGSTGVSCPTSYPSFRCSPALHRLPQLRRGQRALAVFSSAAVMSSEMHTMAPQAAAAATSRNGSSSTNAAGTASSKGPHVVFVLGGPGAGKGTQCELLTKRMNLVHISAGDCLREERQRPGSEHGELIERCIREGTIVPVEITLTLLLKKMLASGWNRHFLIDGFPRNEDNLSGWRNFTNRKNIALKLQQIKGSSPALASQCDMALQQLLQQEKQQQENQQQEQRQGNREETKQEGKKEKEEEEEEDINANSGVPVCFCLYLDCPEGTLEQRLLLRGQKSQRSDDNATAIRKRMVTFKEETLPIVKYFDKQHKVRRIDASAPIDDVWQAVAALFEHSLQSPAVQ